MLTSATQTTRFEISRNSSSIAKNFRSPQIIAPEIVTGNVIIAGLINTVMKIIEVDQTSISGVKEYNATFDETNFNSIEAFVFHRLSATNQFAFIVHWRDTATGLNTDGLNIIILTSGFEYVKAFKTALPTYGVTPFFTS